MEQLYELCELQDLWEARPAAIFSRYCASLKESPRGAPPTRVLFPTGVRPLSGVQPASAAVLLIMFKDMLPPAQITKNCDDDVGNK